jgi:glycosyltransferase involved in cell wall biosynthesis
VQFLDEKDKIMKILMQNRFDAFTKRGGDTYEMLLTKKYLEKAGVAVDFSTKLTPDVRAYDIVHLFNITRIHETYLQLKNAKKAGKNVVLSPIYHSMKDIANYERKNISGLKGLIARPLAGTDAVQLLKTLYYTHAHPATWKAFAIQFMKGYGRMQRESLDSADYILLHSGMEHEAIRKEIYGGLEPAYKSKIVKLGAETAEYKESARLTGWLMQKGLSDYAVCAGRIEPRKNQLKILKALRGTQFKMVFAGRMNEMHGAYVSEFNKSVRANPNAFYLGELAQEELMTLISRAKTSILASWFETTGLTGLEAGLFDCNVVMTEKGYTKEYYNDRVWYCDPESEDSIRKAVSEAMSAARGQKKLKGYILENNFTWQEAAKATLEAYTEVLKRS